MPKRVGPTDSVLERGQQARRPSLSNFFRTRRRWVSRLVMGGLALPALWHVCQLLYLFATRLNHPVDLEWMEGGLLYEATRILEGLPVYPPPDSGYVPFPYPIGYPLLLAALGFFFGVDYALARGISVAATLGAAYVLARQVHAHYGADNARWLMTALTLGAMGAGFAVVDGWYDLARVDSLAAALAIVGAAGVAAQALSRRRALLLGAVLAAAVLTKQSAAAVAVWVVLYAVVRHRRRGLWLAGAAAASFGLALGVLQWWTEGNYWFYTVALLKDHRVHPQRIRDAHAVLLAFAPYASLLLPVAVLLALRRRLSSRSILWLGFLCASWGFGIVSFGKDGGYLNHLIPAVWLVVPTALLLARDALRSGEDTDLAWTLRWLVATAMSLLLVLQVYPAKKFRVTSAERSRAKALDRRISVLEGSLFAPLFPHLATRNGKGAHQVHIEAHNDFIWANLPYRQAYERYFASLAPDFVLLDGTEGLADIVFRDYVIFEHLLPGRFDTRTSIGWSVAPRILLERRVPLRKQRVVFDFEDHDLEGWELRGSSLRRTSSGPGRGQRGVQGVVGRRYLSSYHPRRGDAPTGTALSPPFEIDRSYLGLRVGGGFSERTRVDLMVDGDVIRTALGLDREVLYEVAWDVSRHRGKLARVRVVDEGRKGWGHIMLDHVVLYERAAPAPSGRSTSPRGP